MDPCHRIIPGGFHTVIILAFGRQEDQIFKALRKEGEWVGRVGAGGAEGRRGCNQDVK